MPPITISKDTTLCCSFAERPGNLGTRMFNAAFAAKHLDYIYKAFKVSSNDLPSAIDALRALNIRGCGLSMPHKLEATSLVDSLDPTAARIGAINTIVNSRGRLKGYNTDYYGALQLLNSLPNIRNQSVLLLGAGGVARAICAALDKLGPANVSLVNRDEQAGRSLSKTWQFEFVPWSKRTSVNADLLINATPIGMAPAVSRSPYPLKSLKQFKAIMDVITAPPSSLLLQTAAQQKIKALPGINMALHQAARQFELYTNRPAPLATMRRALLES